jgi:hypothetical protein
MQDGQGGNGVHNGIEDEVKDLIDQQFYDAAVKLYADKKRRKLPQWMYSEIAFRFDNRWRHWKWAKDTFVIWLGTELQWGDEWGKVHNQYTFDFTICNFGFKIAFRGNPAVSFCFMENKKK